MFRIDTDTNIEPYVVEIDEEELDFLHHLGIIGRRSHRSYDKSKRHIVEMRVDFERMAEAMRDYDRLRRNQRTIEDEIIGYFIKAYRSDGRRIFTTGQLADELDHPKSSISRSLNKLTERGELTKVQRGVYELKNEP